MTTTTTQKSSLAPDVYTEARTPLQNMEQQYSPSLTNIDAQPPPAYDSLSGATNTLTLSPSQPETNSDEKPPPSPSSFEEQSLRFNQDDPPLPSSLHRPAPPSPTYTSFPPTYLTANGKHLDEGFPMMLPPPLMQPHPFTSHDVNEAEWKQFLMDLQNTAMLSAGDKVKIGLTGLTTFPLAGPCVTKAVKAVLKDKKRKPIGELVDIWNQRFFHARRIQVILAHGKVRVDSGAGPVPALDQSMDNMTSTSLERRGCHSRCKDRKTDRRQTYCSGEDRRYRLFVATI